MFLLIMFSLGEESCDESKYCLNEELVMRYLKKEKKPTIYFKKEKEHPDPMTKIKGQIVADEVDCEKEENTEKCSGKENTLELLSKKLVPLKQILSIGAMERIIAGDGLQFILNEEKIKENGGVGPKLTEEELDEILKEDIWFHVKGPCPEVYRPYLNINKTKRLGVFEH